jgi:hypothetical protein
MYGAGPAGPRAGTRPLQLQVTAVRISAFPGKGRDVLRETSSDGRNFHELRAAKSDIPST